MTSTETLIDLLAQALPYVEEGATDPCHKESGNARGRKLVNAMRHAIEAHDAPKPFDPAQPIGSDNYPTFPAGAAVLVPDGYNPDGSPRPWIPCTVHDQRARMLHLKNPAGRDVFAPAYAVRVPS